MADLNTSYQISELIAAYAVDPDQKMPEALQNWIAESESNKALFDKLVSETEISTLLQRYQEIDVAEAWTKLHSQLPQKTIPLYRRFRPVAAAAAMAAMVFGVWFYNSSRHSVDSSSRTAGRDLLNDVAPGRQGAILTLANGKKISLSDANKGELAKEAGVTISKSANGQLVYNITPLSAASGADHLMNTLTTAKGETYQIRLPDGSSVWLNAASSLRYPANFASLKERRVQLEGEAYFSVKHNAKQPFRVESNGQIVEDIGTEFNINSYPDESNTKTTLVEGSAMVSPDKTGERGMILKPNQQAELMGNHIEVKEVEAEDAIAWKNGLFIFNDEPLQAILRRVSRWYDVEIIYEEGVNKNEQYLGSVSRYDKVSKILEKIESTGGIHFKIEGRSIRVMK